MRVTPSTTMLPAMMLAALLLAGAAPAQTETLHIRRHAGESAAATMRRVEAAALDLCGASSFSLPEVKDDARATPCFRNAVAGARDQLGLAGQGVAAIRRSR